MELFKTETENKTKIDLPNKAKNFKAMTLEGGENSLVPFQE